ncbi:MAG: phosphatidate cytidylyltransferase [Dehalococcoidia bacterium]|nr:phosphatidate cytidylyltransferase [Dehalococcoidia bacterium]
MLVAAAGVPLIFVLILVGGDWYAAAVAAALAVAALEFQRPRFGWLSPMSLLAATAAAAMAGGAHAGYNWVLWATAAAVLASLVMLVARFDVDTAPIDWSWTTGALLYVGVLGSFVVLVRDLPDGRDWVYLTVFATFATDTAAYFCGRALGRRRLAPRISAAKTVEGFVGGYAAGFAAVVLLNYLLGLRITGWQIAVLALLLPPFATAGDLAESALKRAMRIKDASELIPGHGGVLDRLDSQLFAFALVYLFYQWLVV